MIYARLLHVRVSLQLTMILLSNLNKKSDVIIVGASIIITFKIENDHTACLPDVKMSSRSWRDF